jgi:hypothetical protein
MTGQPLPHDQLPAVVPERLQVRVVGCQRVIEHPGMAELVTRLGPTVQATANEIAARVT